ncbi:hypothetical protein DEO23_05385 [Brachybacterium endophyticum]|uniref:Glycosyltransferase RgtA/B/C/D-like domain-containing protein n=1 Tax=Brachybacterium endophyticum TaxID=2182385 RepID=A0A2U2RKP4_9MICO|nr:hypothetical protein DEO23_05385 [Brachybacterium endophyticum]
MRRRDESTPPTALRASHERVVHGDRSQQEPPGTARSPLWWVLAVITVATCIVLHIVVAQSAVAPRTPWDEIHPLQIARMLSGDNDVPRLSGSGYYPGWAILMTPIWWFTHDPETVYRAAIVLGNVIGVATIVPLSMVGRHLRMTAPQAIAAAGLAMCLPGRIEPSDYAMSEQLLMFCYAWAVLGMFALWRRPTWWRLALFVLAIAAAYLTHTRALALVLTAVVWLLLFSRRSVAKAVVGVLLLLVSWWGVDRVAAAINHRMLLSGSSKSDLALQALTQARPEALAQLLAGQVWAQLVGTAGLFALGAVVIVVWTLREVRTLHLGPGAFLFGLTLSTVGMSVVWWYQPEALWGDSFHGLEAWVYSRYIDQVAPFLVLVAVAVLLRRVSAAVIGIALGVVVLVSAVVVLWVAPHAPLWLGLTTNTAAVNSWQSTFPERPFHEPLTPTFTGPNRFWLWASLATTVGVLATLLLRRLPRSAVALLLVAAVVMSLWANQDQRRAAPKKVGASLAKVDRATASAEPEPVDVDLSCRSNGLGTAEMVNWAGYWYSPRPVRLADPPQGEPFRSDLVISCQDGSTMRERGAELVTGGSSYSFRLWVLPGPLQDQLARDGLLEK